MDGFDIPRRYFNENYYGRRITENLDLLKEYTGQGVGFTMTYGNDVFIFAGESESTLPMSSDTSFTESDGDEAFSTYNTFAWLPLKQIRRKDALYSFIRMLTRQTAETL